MSRESATCKADYYERVADDAAIVIQNAAAMPGDEAVYEAVNELQTAR